MNDVDDRLLMSDSIRGMVPELEEEQVIKLVDAFVVVTLEMSRDSITDIVSGRLVGVSHEEKVTKLDIRLGNDVAYGLFKTIVQDSLTCVNVYLHLAEDETKFSGPFKVTSPKLVDFDSQHKMCTLGLDLIKA